MAEVTESQRAKELLEVTASATVTALASASEIMTHCQTQLLIVLAKHVDRLMGEMTVADVNEMANREHIQQLTRDENAHQERMAEIAAGQVQCLRESGAGRELYAAN